MRVALGDSRLAAAVGPDAVGVVGHRIRTAQQEDAERVAVVGIAGRRSDVHLDGAGGAGLSVDDPSYRDVPRGGFTGSIRVASFSSTPYSQSRSD